MQRRGIVLGSLAVLVVGAMVAGSVARRPQLPPAERGRRLAAREGSFGCHGPEGTRGAGNPGRPSPEVPNFEGDQMMYAQGADDVRAWIRDGVTPAKAASTSWKRERDAGALRMPAFKNRLSRGQIDDLVAFVVVMGGVTPEDSLARHGRERAKVLGCFGCHGPEGRFARPNPGSWKGYIPSWDGRDFPDLVRNRAEFEEWTRRGLSERFERNRFARFFLTRAAIHMPAFDRFLEPGDVDALWAYVEWLRRPAMPDSSH
jgi:mono/diheme cytochrome c family protein